MNDRRPAFKLFARKRFLKSVPPSARNRGIAAGHQKIQETDMPFDNQTVLRFTAIAAATIALGACGGGGDPVEAKNVKPAYLGAVATTRMTCSPPDLVKPLWVLQHFQHQPQWTL